MVTGDWLLEERRSIIGVKIRFRKYLKYVITTNIPTPWPSTPFVGTPQRRDAIADLDWRKSGLNVLFRGFAPPRGKYKVILRTSKRGVEIEEGSTANEGKEEKTSAEEGKGGGGRGRVSRMEKVEDEWIVSYVLAPPAVRWHHVRVFITWMVLFRREKAPYIDIRWLSLSQALIYTSSK